MEKYIGFFSTLPKDIVEYELLSYHEYGKEKWLKLGLEYTVKDAFVDQSLIRRYEEMFRATGLKIKHT